MPTIYIICPTTKQRVSTGFSLPKDFDRNSVKENAFQCPACGQMHTWNGVDAIFDKKD
jgi:hypothetical protein